MATVKSIKDEAQFQQETTSATKNTLLILYFHAPWAAPCTQMAAIIEALASTYPADAPISFLSINAEELPEVSEEHEVEAVPLVVLKRDGKVVEKMSGVDAARLRALVDKEMQSDSGNSARLPPAQQVTRPAEQPVAQPAPKAEGTPAMTAAQKTSYANANATAKNLSAYVPSANDSQPAAEPVTSPEDLQKRLSELVKAAPVMLFMKGTPSAPQCGFSRQLVGILRENGVRYGFFNILADEEVRQGLKTFADWPTFPQLWLQGELVGGLDIIKEELDNDPAFFADYSVDVKNKGGITGPEAQKAPGVTA